MAARATLRTSATGRERASRSTTRRARCAARRTVTAMWPRIAPGLPGTVQAINSDPPVMTARPDRAAACATIRTSATGRERASRDTTRRARSAGGPAATIAMWPRIAPGLPGTVQAINSDPPVMAARSDRVAACATIRTSATGQERASRTTTRRARSAGGPAATIAMWPRIVRAAVPIARWTTSNRMAPRARTTACSATDQRSVQTVNAFPAHHHAWLNAAKNPMMCAIQHHAAAPMTLIAMTARSATVKKYAFRTALARSAAPGHLPAQPANAAMKPRIPAARERLARRMLTATTVTSATARSSASANAVRPGRRRARTIAARTPVCAGDVANHAQATLTVKMKRISPSVSMVSAKNVVATAIVTQVNSFATSVRIALAVHA